MKGLITLWLALALVCSVMTVPAFAAETTNAYYYTGAHALEPGLLVTEADGITIGNPSTTNFQYGDGAATIIAQVGHASANQIGWKVWAAEMASGGFDIDEAYVVKKLEDSVTQDDYDSIISWYNSFTGGWYPDLTKYKPVRHDMDLKMDFIVDDLSGFYAIAFDTHGKLGWKSNKIIDPDGDPGYDGAQIIEVLSEDVDERYLGYLEAMEIPYIFAGEKSIDVELALFKLKNIIGCTTLLLEGGSIINGAFERAGAVDELSLVVAPTVAGNDSKPLFMDANVANFEIVSADKEDGNLVLKYKRK